MSRRFDPLGRHRAPVAVVLVVLAIAIAIFFTIRTGTGEHRSASPPTPSSTAAAPAGPGAELVRLLAHSGTLDFDVRYTTVNQSSASSSAHLWRRPPLARLDTETGSGDAARRSSEILTTSGPVSCTQVGAEPWSCAPKPGLKIGDLGVVPPVVVAALSSLQVTARDDTVVGMAVRCFTVSGGHGPSAELCLTPDGIPARMVAGAARLDLVSLSRTRPPDSVFEPPAPPRA